MRRLHSRVHIKVFAGDDDLFVEIVNFFLFQLGHLLDHIVARDKDSLEVGRIGEGLLILHFAIEVRLAIVLRIVLHTLLLSLLVGLLDHIGDQEVIHDCLIRLLRVLIQIALLAVDIEASLGLPPFFVLLFVLDGDQIFINQGERLRQVVLRVRVEVGRIVLNHVAQFLLLHLPNVVPLAAILENLDTIGHFDSCFERPPRAHVANRLPVSDDKVTSWSH
mmetsp:Transcript_29345/g.36441  ORF Transcript_29345/g.36441 Transcript_29345/m.36441 type:complete len:220 (+) Transcript_29345:445-1104(+)